MHQTLPSQIILKLRNLILDPNVFHYRRIKITLWLYLYLILKFNPETGKHLFNLQEGERETGIREETLRS